jgi:hypothetical protein
MNPRRNRKRKKRMSGRGRAPLSDVGPVEVGVDYMIVLGSLNSMQRRLAKRHAKQVLRDMRHNMRAMGKMISARLNKRSKYPKGLKGYRIEHGSGARARAIDLRSEYPAELQAQIERHGLDVYLPPFTRTKGK